MKPHRHTSTSAPKGWISVLWRTIKDVRPINS